MTVTRSMSSIDVIADCVREGDIDLGSQTSPDGAVTLLFAEGSGAAPALLDHEDAVVARHGDAVLLAFSSALTALRCALELQAGAQGAGLRLGLHTGHVIASPGGMFGRNVVLAARIAARARGGEILVSHTFRRYTQGDPRLSFHHHGDVHFRGIAGEHSIHALALEEEALP